MDEHSETAMDGQLFAEILADHVSFYRSNNGLTQDQVARGMQDLGHSEWSRPTVSEVERGRRSVSAAELAGLAIVLGESPTSLLDPTSVGDSPVRVQVGNRSLDPWLVHSWLRGFVRIRHVGLFIKGDELLFTIVLTPEGTAAMCLEGLAPEAAELLKELQDLELKHNEIRRRVRRKTGEERDAEEPGQ